MKIIQCSRCGSQELAEKGGYLVCEYCQSRFSPQDGERPTKESTIGVGSDIEALLQKCRDEPWNSQRYAELVLDLDPTNQEAMAYIG
jgi:hypothetical protein